MKGLDEEKLLGWLLHWYAISEEIEEQEENQAYKQIEYIIKSYFDEKIGQIE